MKPRWILLALLAVAVSAGVAARWPRGPREPVYQGKKLSRWIAEGCLNSYPEADARARAAIKASGTNALAYFLYQFTREESASANRLKREIWTSTDGRANPVLRFDRLFIAQRGIVLMAPDAASALPTLAHYLDDPRRNRQAVIAMGGGGEEALPYLRKVAASSDMALVSASAIALREVAKTTEAALPLLIRLLEPTNEATQIRAVESLYGVKLRPDLVVPALSNALFHSNDMVRQQAAHALGDLGPAAKVAIPRLLTLMRLYPPYVADSASNAVIKIDPTALVEVRRSDTSNVQNVRRH